MSNDTKLEDAIEMMYVNFLNRAWNTIRKYYQIRNEMGDDTARETLDIQTSALIIDIREIKQALDQIRKIKADKLARLKTVEENHDIY